MGDSQIWLFQVIGHFVGFYFAQAHSTVRITPSSLYSTFFTHFGCTGSILDHSYLWFKCIHPLLTCFGLMIGCKWPCQQHSAHLRNTCYHRELSNPQYILYTVPSTQPSHRFENPLANVQVNTLSKHKQGCTQTHIHAYVHIIRMLAPCKLLRLADVIPFASCEGKLMDWHKRDVFFTLSCFLHCSTAWTKTLCLCSFKFSNLV